jgi:hypothetical protein
LVKRVAARQPFCIGSGNDAATVSLSLHDMETELMKRTAFKYTWGRVQDNAYDDLTRFVYNIERFDTVIAAVKQRFGDHPDIKALGNYAVNRWYNFTSAKAVEEIFKQHASVTPAAHDKDRFCDFFIQNIPFDLKTTNFPKRCGFTFAHALKHPEDLALWYYEMQSKEQREHYHNRLFLVLHKTLCPHMSWTLKARLSWLQPIVKNYLDNFCESSLIKLRFNGATAITDILWCYE